MLLLRMLFSSECLRKLSIEDHTAHGKSLWRSVVDSKNAHLEWTKDAMRRTYQNLEIRDRVEGLAARQTVLGKVGLVAQHELEPPPDVRFVLSPEPQILWDATVPIRPMKSPPIADCLRRFVALAYGRDQAIAKFAARFGPLGVTMERCPAPEDYAAPVSMTQQEYPHGLWLSEPVASWRKYARHAYGILLVASYLAEPRAAPPRGWGAIAGRDHPDTYSMQHMYDSLPPLPHLRNDALALQQYRWETEANRWLQKMTVVPRIVGRQAALFHYERVRGENALLPTVLMLDYTAADWPIAAMEIAEGGDAPEGELAPSPLFMLLALQLAAAVTGGIYRCDVCGGPIVRAEGERRLRADYKRLCSDGCRSERRREVERESKRKARIKQTSSRPTQ